MKIKSYDEPTVTMMFKGRAEIKGVKRETAKTITVYSADYKEIYSKVKEYLYGTLKVISPFGTVKLRSNRLHFTPDTRLKEEVILNVRSEYDCIELYELIKTAINNGKLK